MKLRPLGLVMCHFERSREAHCDDLTRSFGIRRRVLDYARTDSRDARTDKDYARTDKDDPRNNKGDARTESDARTDTNSQIKNQIIFEIIK